MSNNSPADASALKTAEWVAFSTPPHNPNGPDAPLDRAGGPGPSPSSPDSPALLGALGEERFPETAGDGIPAGSGSPAGNASETEKPPALAASDASGVDESDRVVTALLDRGIVTLRE